MKKIVIVGGVAGGASCAARLRRLDENAEITILERGANVSFANCGLPYHIGGIIEERDKLLLHTPSSLWNRFRIKALVNTTAMSIDRHKKSVTVRQIDANGMEKVHDLEYDFLILSPGANPIVLNIPGKNLPGVFSLRSLEDMDGIKDFIQAQSVKSAVVVGAGFIGIEVAENLVHRGIKTHIVEKTEQLMPLLDPEIAAYLHVKMQDHGINLHCGLGATAIEQTHSGLKVTLDNGSQLEGQLVIMAVGVLPEVDLARRADLALGALGGIKTDSQMRTSDPFIFAVGDAVEVRDLVSSLQAKIALAGPANRQGRLVADVISGRNVQYRGALGSNILKAFDLSIAGVGLSEKQAKRLKIPHLVAHVVSNSHATYYPGAEQLLIKGVFSPEGNLLGAQAVGKAGIDKRIDVLATAIFAKLNVEDLQYLDLAYAPPYSSAKDPVNHLATLASGVISGDHPVVSIQDLKQELEHGTNLLLDVRNLNEYQRGTIAGAVLIPVNELRDRLHEIPKDKPIIVFCQVGMRGYIATRILLQNGYKVKNLMGGYSLYNTVTQASSRKV